jgi:hypothetical protein
MAAGLLARVLAARGTDADTAERKCRVIETLARSGEQRHGPLVSSAMADPVAKVRRAAVAAAVTLRHRDAPEVLGALAESDVSEAVRSAACGAIGALGLASLVKTLERVARLDRDARVRLAASTALASPWEDRSDSCPRNPIGGEAISTRARDGRGAEFEIHNKVFDSMLVMLKPAHTPPAGPRAAPKFRRSRTAG